MGHDNFQARLHHGSIYSRYLFHYISIFSDGGTGAYVHSPNEAPLDPEYLPKGKCPLWIRKEKNVEKKEVLQKIQELINIDYKGMSVTLLYKNGHQEIHKLCKDYGWQYVQVNSICGSEDEVIVVFDDRPSPESISRARNGLYIITNHG